MGAHDSFILTIDFCGVLVNTLILVLCWLPPVLHRRQKIGLTIVYFAPILVCFVDWQEIALNVAAMVGISAPPVPAISRCVVALTFLAEAAFLCMVIVYWIWLVFELARRHSSPYLEEEDPEE
jgi:hypothetical protein